MNHVEEIDDDDEESFGEGGTETEEAYLDDDDGDEGENLLMSLLSDSEQNSTIRRRLRAERRRVLATRKKEYDKQATIEKLLSPTAKSPRSSPSKLKQGTVKPQPPPMITYKITKDLNTVSFPVGFPCDILPRRDKLEARDAVEPVKCGVEGCMKLKRYTCSKTNVQLCSLECYRNNLCDKS